MNVPRVLFCVCRMEVRVMYKCGGLCLLCDYVHVCVLGVVGVCVFARRSVNAIGLPSRKLRDCAVR